jgi:transcriptional regulator with XRE-family HTH domain
LSQDDLRELKWNVGLRIAEIRSQFGLTQPDLAAKLEAEQRWIARIESGRQNLTLATLLKLSKALGVHISDFFQEPKKKAVRGRPRKKNLKTPSNNRGGK